MHVRGKVRDRYPPPWDVEEIPGGYRVVCRSLGIAVAYVYSYRPDERPSTPAAKLLAAEAKAIALAIAGLPHSLG